MSKTKKEIDFTTGSIYKKMFLFSIPLLLGNLLQQIYFIADSIIVGRLIGSEALAAVGAATSITVLLIFFFQGVASGAGILVSQYIGAGEPHRMQKVIKASSIFTVVAGGVLSVVGCLFTGNILRWISVPDEVFQQTYMYLVVALGGMLPMLIYNMGTAIMQAMGDAKTPLYYLAVASVINIVLDIVFVKYMGMGVEGTAVATVIAQLVSAILIMISIRSKSKSLSIIVDKNDEFPLKHYFKNIITLGIPIGVQAIVINFSGIITQNHINGIGADAMAGWSIFSRIDTFVILPFISYGIAITTFTGQNYGAGNIKRIFKGVQAGMVMSVGITVGIGVIICLCPEFFFRFFTDEEIVLEYACDMIWHMVPYYFLLAMAKVHSSAVSGTGNSVVPMITNILFMCVTRIILIPIFTQMIGHNMTALYWTYLISWILSAVSIGGYYEFKTKKQLKAYGSMV